jgi:hypothetical protein
MYFGGKAPYSDTSPVGDIVSKFRELGAEIKEGEGPGVEVICLGG